MFRKPTPAPKNAPKKKYSSDFQYDEKILIGRMTFAVVVNLSNSDNMNRHDSNSSIIKAIAISFCILLCSSIFIIPKPAKAQGSVAGSNELREVHLRMCSDGLSPITPSEDTSGRRKAVPNGFVHGRLDRFGSVEFKKVGEWKLDNIIGVITIQQPVTFKLWVSTTSGSQSGDFRFTLKYGSAVVAGPTETYVSGITVEPKGIEVEAHANLTTTEAGKALTLIVEGAINGDSVMVEYGDFQKDSGVTFTSNAIKFVSLHACHKEISVEFSDAFRASINDLYPVLIVDGYELSEEKSAESLERERSDLGNDLFIWKVRTPPGTHVFQIGIAYAKKDINTSWNIQRALTIHPQKEDPWYDLEFGNMMTAFLFLLILIIYFIASISIARTRSSSPSIFVRMSPVPDGYKKVIEKRKANFSKKTNMLQREGQKKPQRLFRAKKKMKLKKP